MKTSRIKRHAWRGTLTLACTLPACLIAGCSGEDATVIRESVLLPQKPAASGQGSVALAISSGGVPLRSLRFSVEDPSGRRVLEESLEADGPDGLFSFEFAAPIGAGYELTLTAESEAGISCSGSTRFDVAVDATTELQLALACEAAGNVRVVGNLFPAASCPDVELLPLSAPVHVGETIQLRATSALVDGVSYAWAASGGSLEDSRNAAASFSCTAAGPVTLTLTADQAGCTDVASVEIECLPPAEGGACAGLGSNCHVVDPGSGALHACHELGHGGDEAACSTGRAACVEGCGAALCETLGSLCHEVDPGSGPLHDCHELGHAGDVNACFEGGRECFDLCTAALSALREPVSISFEARVGAAPFACGSSYADIGATAITAEPQDLRFYVSDVRMLRSDGSEEPVEIEARAPWQLASVALLDFENAEGLCVSGNAATNASVTGRVLPGEYVGIAFRVGVPEALNHSDPVTLAAPLELGAMSWGWLLGYKFLRAEMVQTGVEAGAPAVGLVHLGSTACSGNPQAGTVVCANPNRNEVRLTGFDPATSRIVADVAALFAEVDLTQDGLCHASEEVCAAPFESLGIALATGQASAAQTFFRVE